MPGTTPVQMHKSGEVVYNLVQYTAALPVDDNGQLPGVSGPLATAVHQYGDVGNLLAGFVPLKRFDTSAVRERIRLTRRLLAQHASLMGHGWGSRRWIEFKLGIFRYFLESKLLADDLLA